MVRPRLCVEVAEVYSLAYPAETAKALLEEHGLEVSDSREKNVNTFMCHCGIKFQLVRLFFSVLGRGVVRCQLMPVIVCEVGDSEGGRSDAGSDASWCVVRG